MRHAQGEPERGKEEKAVADALTHDSVELQMTLLRDFGSSVARLHAYPALCRKPQLNQMRALRQGFVRRRKRGDMRVLD